MKRILILYGFDQSGHHSAAAGLGAAFRSVGPGLRVDLLNFFNYTSVLLERMATGTFYRMLRTTPTLWDNIYRSDRSDANFSMFRKLVRLLSPRGVEEVLDVYNPDAVLCTQTFPCGMVSDFKARAGRHIPLYAVITDYFVPRYWIYPGVDAYFVGSGEAALYLGSSGFPFKRVFNYGIPVNPNFSEPFPRDEARRIFGLPEDVPVIMIMGGWSGWGPLYDLTASMMEGLADCAFVVVSGSNADAYEALESKYGSWNSRLMILRFIERTDILMRAADVVVGKAGGMTSAEVMASGTPFVLFSPIPGQEKANADYLISRGAAVLAADTREAVRLVKKILHDSGYRGSLISATRLVAKPKASIRIAEEVMEKTYAALHCV